MSATISDAGSFKLITDPDPTNEGQGYNIENRVGRVFDGQENLRLDAEGYQEVMDFVRIFAIRNAIAFPTAIEHVRRVLGTINRLPEVTATRVATLLT